MSFALFTTLLVVLSMIPCISVPQISTPSDIMQSSPIFNLVPSSAKRIIACPIVVPFPISIEMSDPPIKISNSFVITMSSAIRTWLLFPLIVIFNICVNFSDSIDSWLLSPSISIIIFFVIFFIIIKLRFSALISFIMQFPILLLYIIN